MPAMRRCTAFASAPRQSPVEKLLAAFSLEGGKLGRAQEHPIPHSSDPSSVQSRQNLRF